MLITSTALAVVGHQASNRAIAQATLLFQPQEECFCISSGADGLSIYLQQSVGMDRRSLSLLLGFCFESFQQAYLLANHQRLICHQAAVEAALLVVAPYLGGDGVGFNDRHRITPAT